MNAENSTICAISTSPGNGAIAVIRISGKDAYSITSSIFTSPANKDINNEKANSIIFGIIKYDTGEILDEVLLSLFRGPHSFTGEDTIEISCHGSAYIQSSLLQLLIKNGAKLARPGEFTMRAYMNGKMDLVQAEGVADIISAHSEASHRLAVQQMRGGFSGEISELRSRLLHFISMIELELDFSEEDVEFADRSELKALISEIQSKISSLLHSFQLGNAIKKGIPVAIIGKPNAGKSTLLNLLLKEDKAIVSEIAGTTRDVIEDVINIQGYSFRFIDTAGLRKTADAIETLGIQRTEENIKKSRIVLLLINRSDDLKEMKYYVDEVEKNKDQELIILLNKIDLIDKEEELKKIKKIVGEQIPLIPISATNKTNFNILEKNLVTSANLPSINKNDIILSNTRHYEALYHASQALNRIDEGIDNQLYTDLLAMDIRQALHHLGEITGEISTEEVLGNIFKNFCIGK